MFCSYQERILSVDLRYDVDDGWSITFSDDPALSHIFRRIPQSQPLLRLQIG
jgi:hypothetical protein